jgi:hypothetical protein
MSETFLMMRRNEQEMIKKMYIGLHYSSQILKKVEFSRQIFEKYSNKKIRPVGAELFHPNGRTDRRT